MEDKLKQELSRENLNRLSSEFEVELLRLIKTLNLISQSRELYKNQVEQMESISSSLKIRINDFTIRLLEMEKAARESMREQRTSFSSPGDSADSTDYETLIREVNEFREKIDSVDKDIEKAKLEHLSKLDSFYSVYNLELKASQGELDTKLSDLKDVISEAVPAVAATAAPIEPEPEPEPTPEPEVHTPPESEPVHTNGSSATASEETPAEFTPPAEPLSEHDHPKSPDIPKRHINLSNKRANGSSAYSSNGVLMGIIFIFFGALVGVTSFYLLDYISEDNVPGDTNQAIYSEIESAQEQELASNQPENIEETSEIQAEQEPQVIEEPEVIIVENTQEQPLEVPAPKAPEKENNIFSRLNQPEDQSENKAAEVNSSPEIAPGSDKYTVVGVGANVRNGPGINHEVATVVLEGDQFSGLGETRGIWIKVLTPDGKEGWISRKVVKKIN